MVDKIINNSYDAVDYGQEALSQSPIAINPLVSDQYEEATSENIEDIYTRKNLYNQMSELYEASEFYEKYGQDCKKLEKADISNAYYTFKRQLFEKDDYNLVQVFTTIAEFFDLNYKTLYNDIISLEDKAEILEILRDMYGLESQFAKSKKLF